MSSWTVTGDPDAPVDLVSNHDRLVACLRELVAEREAEGLPPLVVFDGEIDDDQLHWTHPDEGPQRVLPYVVVWPSRGRPLPKTERPASWSYTSGVTWRPQVTIAAGHPAWVIGAVDVVRLALARLQLPGGGVLTEDEDGGQEAVIRDPDVDSDTRWYTPLLLHALIP